VHLLLTDRLICPRCGPTFGLILLADRMIDRRVWEGTLGCPNCRDSFSVESGFADLRAPPRGPLLEGRAGSPPEGDEESEDVERIVALLGIHRGPGTVALVGRAARHAAEVADAVEDLQTVAVDADTRSWPDRPGMSRMVAEPGLPFFSQMLRGSVVDGVLGSGLVVEAARVVAPGSRTVVTDAPEGAEGALEEAGLSILASESRTVVAARG